MVRSMNEEWRKVFGYESKYLVSNYGRVKSIGRKDTLGRYLHEKVMKINTATIYPSVSLYICGKKKMHNIHRLVAIAFIPNPYNKPCVNHIDGNKENNFVENLEWATHSENQYHACDIGLMPSGEDSHMSKLSENDVLQIRSIFDQGFFTYKEIANAFDVTLTNVHKIVKMETWRNV